MNNNDLLYIYIVDNTLINLARETLVNQKLVKDSLNNIGEAILETNKILKKIYNPE
jgi:hypothetical protein